MPGEWIVLSCVRAGKISEKVLLLIIGQGQEVEDVYYLSPCLVVPGDMQAGLFPDVDLCAVDALQLEATPRFCPC